jgi:2-methylcitrate dehydratase PrpD
MSHNFTEQLIEYALGVQPNDLSGDARRTVELAFIDTLGCALSGSSSDEAMIAGAWALGLGANEEATLIGRGGQRLPSSLAALVNSTAAHALDYDDVSPMMTHPSACLVPPLLAVAERRGSSGQDVMMAYVTGFEVCVRLCRLLNPPHYYRGWHSMGTVNVLGVAAAVSRLIGLDAAGVRNAIAIAAASSAGIRKNFGTFVKPLHAGQAAFHGIQAAELTADGFIADDSILDGQHGFLEVFGDTDTVVPRSVGAPLELTASGLIFKRYACCGALHPAMDAVIDLVVEHELGYDDIDSIACAVNSRALHVLVYHEATTPAEGRFSVEYSLAVAALDRSGGPAQYTPQRIAETDVHDLSKRVEVSVDHDLPTGYALFPAIVAIRTRAGATFSKRVDYARGTPETPMTEADIRAKFTDCAAFVLDSAATERAVAAIDGLLDSPDVSTRVRVLGG